MIKFDTINGTLCRMVEPKPLLADARVGWICRHRNGAYSQIDGIDYPCPVIDCISIGKNRYDRDGKHSGEDMRLNPNPDLDIISCEPLAPIGSAEWAWQMAKLGIETKCSRGKIRISKSGMIEVCYNGMAYAMPMTQSPENRQYVINKMRECSPDGWQLYEPEPEPAVGDWVELTDGLQCCLTECLNPNSGHWLAKTVDGSKVSVWEKNSVRTIARTIQKSEVKVSIKVTLEGTVTNITNNTESFLMWHGENPDKHAEIIRYADIDPATAELVRELVAKQEEE